MHRRRDVKIGAQRGRTARCLVQGRQGADATGTSVQTSKYRWEFSMSGEELAATDRDCYTWPVCSEGRRPHCAGCAWCSGGGRGYAVRAVTACRLVTRRSRLCCSSTAPTLYF